MAKKKTIDVMNKATRDTFDEVWRELKQESDRGAVLVGAAFLDTALESLIRLALVENESLVNELFGFERPLSSFSAKIRIAFCPGLLERNVYQDLQIIRKMRNDFAHLHDHLSFETPRIRDQCMALKTLKRVPPLPPDTGWRPTIRNRFMLAINMLYYAIEMPLYEIPRPRVPPDTSLSPGWDSMSEYPDD